MPRSRYCFNYSRKNIYTNSRRKQVSPFHSQERHTFLMSEEPHSNRKPDGRPWGFGGPCPSSWLRW